jgi:hypothetical protein
MRRAGSRRPLPVANEETDSILFECRLDVHQVRSAGHGERRGRLFGLFWPLTLAQSHTRAAAILVDEFNTGSFERLPHNNQRCTSSVE